MSTKSEQVRDGKAAVDKLQGGVKSIADAAEAAETLQKTGATLNQLESALTKLTWLSKVSGGLQVLSVGLAILQSFLPDIPTIEDKILAGVKRLESQLEVLSINIHRMFAENARLSEAQGQEERLKDHYAVVEKAAEHKAKLAEHTAALQAKGGHDSVLEQKIENHKNDLLHANVAQELEKALIAIHDVAVGAHGKPLPQLTYELSYGNIQVVAALSAKLTGYAQSAAVTLATISVLKIDSSKLSIDQASELADDEYSLTQRLSAINTACHKWCDKCLHMSGWKTEVERYVDNFMDKWDVRADNTKGAASKCVAALGDQWPILNFTAIVYPATSGHDNFYWHKGIGQPSHVFERVRTSGIEARQAAKLLIYFAPRYRPEIVKPKLTVKLSKNKPETSFTAYARYMSNSFLKVDWNKKKNRTRLSLPFVERWPIFQDTSPGDMPDVMMKTFYNLKYRGAADKGWKGSLMWAGRMIQRNGYADGYYMDNDAGMSKFMAICTQNEAEIYRPRWVTHYSSYGTGQYISREGVYDPNHPDHTGTITYQGICSVLVRPDPKPSNADAVGRNIASAWEKMKEEIGKIGG